MPDATEPAPAPNPRSAMGTATNTEIQKRPLRRGPAFVAPCHEGAAALRWRYLDAPGTGVHTAS